jgi:hypothetical protein
MTQTPMADTRAMADGSRFTEDLLGVMPHLVPDLWVEDRGGGAESHGR